MERPLQRKVQAEKDVERDPDHKCLATAEGPALAAITGFGFRGYSPNGTVVTISVSAVDVPKHAFAVGTQPNEFVLAVFHEAKPDVRLPKHTASIVQSNV